MKFFSTFALILLLLSTVILSVQCGEEAHINTRVKRGYYDDYGTYSGTDYLREFIAALILIGMLSCCCIPCICAAGIWFAGWFGIRQKYLNKTEVAATKTSASVPVPSPPPISIPVQVKETSVEIPPASSA